VRRGRRVEAPAKLDFVDFDVANEAGRDEIDWGRSFLARRQVGIGRGIVLDDVDRDLTVFGLSGARRETRFSQHDAAIDNCDRKGNLLPGLEFDRRPKILGARRFASAPERKDECTECKGQRSRESYAHASDRHTRIDPVEMSAEAPLSLMYATLLGAEAMAGESRLGVFSQKAICPRKGLMILGAVAVGVYSFLFASTCARRGPLPAQMAMRQFRP
jgi:hypothetical protein